MVFIASNWVDPFDSPLAVLSRKRRETPTTPGKDLVDREL